MRIPAEATEELADLLMHHRVARDLVAEGLQLLRGRQLSVQEHVADLDEVALLGQLVDRIAAIEQHAFVTIDIRDRALAACRRLEARVVGEHICIGIEFADVDDIRTNRSLGYRQFNGLVSDGQARLAGRFRGRRDFRHSRSPVMRCA